MERDFGEPIKVTFLTEVTSENDPSVRDGWEVTPETRHQIEEIEANIRSSDQRSGMFVFR